MWEELERFANQLKGTSGGQIDVQLFAAGEIVPGQHEFEAVLDGTLEMGHTSATYMTGRIGQVGALLSTSWPAGISMWQYMEWVDHYGGLEIIQESYTTVGLDLVEIYPLTPHGPENFGYFNKKINSSADLEGIKFRSSGIWGNILTEHFDAAVTNLPGGELYQALERGVIDAFEFSCPANNWPLGFHEVAKYLYVPGLHSPMGCGHLIMPRSLWDTLTPELQNLIKLNAHSTGFWAAGHENLADALAMQKFYEYAETHDDFEVIELPQEVQDAVVSASEAFFADYVASGKDPMFAKAYKSMKEYMELSELAQVVWP